VTTPIQLSPAFQEGTPASTTPTSAGGGGDMGGWEVIKGDGGTPLTGAAEATPQEWEILKRDELSLSISSVGSPHNSPRSPGLVLPSPPLFSGLRSPLSVMARGLGRLGARQPQPAQPLASTPRAVSFGEDAQRVLDDLISQVRESQSGGRAGWGSIPW
jgi:hypothetical protein